MARYCYRMRVQTDAHDTETGILFAVVARNPWDAMRKAVEWCDHANIAPEELVILEATPD